MAETDVSGFSGTVSINATGNPISATNVHGGQARAFTFSATQRKKDTSRYGGGRFSAHRGGLIDVGGQITVFLRTGSAANDAVGIAPLGSTNASGLSNLEPDGAYLSLTASTGCVWAGAAILDFSIGHTMGDPAVEATYSFSGNGIWTEQWQ